MAIRIEDRSSIDISDVVGSEPENIQPPPERQYFEARATRSSPGDFNRVLANAGKPVLLEGDEPPTGWLDRT